MQKAAARAATQEMMRLPKEPDRAATWLKLVSARENQFCFSIGVCDRAFPLRHPARSFVLRASPLQPTHSLALRAPTLQPTRSLALRAPTLQPARCSTKWCAADTGSIAARASSRDCVRGVIPDQHRTIRSLASLSSPSARPTPLPYSMLRCIRDDDSGAVLG